MGGGKGGSKMKVTDYYMSIHFGLCHAVDAVTGIYYGQKKFWAGEQTGPGTLHINSKWLFGGNKKEGGVAGAILVLPGGPNQVLPDELAERMGRTPKTCPGYRGITSLFFVGGSNWDGTYPDVSNVVEIPATGLVVTAGSRLVGFTLTLAVGNSDGRVIALQSDDTPRAEDLPAVALGLNASGSPPPEGDSVMGHTGFLYNRYAWEDNGTAPPTGTLTTRRLVGTANSTGTVVTNGQDVTGDTVHLACTFDGVTGAFKAMLDGATVIDTVLPPVSLTLYQFRSNQIYGESALTVTGDISDPAFPTGVTPITDVI